MTAPTQAAIQRAIRAAKKEGKVALVTASGVALVDPAWLALPSQEGTMDADLIQWGPK